MGWTCVIKSFAFRRDVDVPLNEGEACFDDLKYPDGNGRQGGWALVVPKAFLVKDKEARGEVKVTSPFQDEGIKSEVYSCKLIF